MNLTKRSKQYLQSCDSRLIIDTNLNDLHMPTSFCYFHDFDLVLKIFVPCLP